MSQNRWLVSVRSRLVCATLLFAAVGTPAGAQIAFTDVTDQAGIGLDGLTVESAAWGDYDDDGDLDLFLSVSGGPDALFRNDGGGLFTDVAATAGLDDGSFHVGTAFGDLDNDGDLDLYVVNGDVGPDALFRNDGPIGPGGEILFTDVAVAAGIADDETSLRGMGFLDYDADGLLDIYVTALGPDLLYHNLGDLTFENVAAELGVATDGTGVGFAASDIDNNGWIDIFTGNRSGDLNRLYLNDGGIFTDVTESFGIDEIGLGMGVLAFDFDNDLDFDLYWTSWPGEEPGGPQPNALYRNVGAGFVERAQFAGVGDPLGWGVSCNAGDINNDGWMDFVVTNGASVQSTASVLYLNEQDGGFADITALIGGADFDGRGGAFADFDGDGDQDLIITGGVDATTRLWRNDTVNSNSWLTLELVGSTSNRSAIGARIEVTTDLGTTVREVSGGAGRGSQNSLPVEFGLGAAAGVESVMVRWPSGRTHTIGPLALGEHHRIVEPPSLATGGPCPGIIEITATGLTPAGEFVVVASSEPGAAIVPGGTCAGAELELADPRLLDRLSADSEGRILLTPEVPQAACGTWLQLIDLSTCLTSNIDQIAAP